MSQFSGMNQASKVLPPRACKMIGEKRRLEASISEVEVDDPEVENGDTTIIHLQPITEPVSFSFDYQIDETWVSASSTRNYLNRDPLLDYLSYHHTALNRKHPVIVPTVLSSSRERDPTNFNDYIMTQGKKFEQGVYSLLFRKFDPSEIRDLGGDWGSCRPVRKFQDTIEAMTQGLPILINAVLHDPESKTYGIADLIVRSDYFRRLVSVSPLTHSEEHHPAPLFKGRKYHYRVIDVKFHTLFLRSDGIHLLNSGSIPAFKGQLCIYNRIVAKVQGYDPGVSYVLGRRWKYSSKGNDYFGSSCFDRLGSINYTIGGVDNIIVQRTQDAINWIRDMRENGEEWDPFVSPAPRKELHANMCNRNDHPWHDVKVAIAASTKEITTLWMCGPKNREIAHSHGVIQWTDPRCTPETLGVTGEKRSRVLAEILKINQGIDVPPNTKILPEYVTNNLFGWKNERDIEFFVDFESGPDICPDFANLPEGSSHSSIIMIGVGYLCPELDEWIYRDFTVDRNILREEKKICADFAAYITETARKYSAHSIGLYHWSRAEPQMWLAASLRHDALLDGFWTDIDQHWVDLLEVFREEPIVIKGCFNFGLKDVVKAMHEHGLISTMWDKENPCSDGAAAMVMAQRASEEAERRQVSMRELPLIQYMQKYNEIDCKVLAELLIYLRKHHSQPPRRSKRARRT